MEGKEDNVIGKPRDKQGDKERKGSDSKHICGDNITKVMEEGTWSGETWG